MDKNKEKAWSETQPGLGPRGSRLDCDSLLWTIFKQRKKTGPTIYVLAYNTNAYNTDNICISNDKVTEKCNFKLYNYHPSWN